MFYSHNNSHVNTNCSYISSTDDFDNVYLALFIACKTAHGGEGARNLPSAIVEQGAQAAVGFKNNIGCSSANSWSIELFSHLIEGNTLQQAVYKASQGFSESTGLNYGNVVICGDENMSIS